MPTVIERAGGHIGSVVSSMLTETQFQALHGTGWVLMDGRSCVGSTYASITGAATIPDARGMILRGKNNGRSDGNQDPSGERTTGSFQSHATAKNGLALSDSGHGHTITRPAPYGDSIAIDTLSLGSQGYRFGAAENLAVGGSAGVIAANPTTTGITLGSGDAETRMRNIAVNHFIKIN